MAEKNFSDFQENECADRQQITFKKKPKPCPTCIENPDYFLEKNWFEMSKPWLDEKECRYKVRVSKNEFVDYNKRLPDNDQELVRFGIRKLLIHYNKYLANETVCAFGGCMASFDEILEFKDTISEYQKSLGDYESTQSTQELSAVGGLGAALLATFGAAGGVAVLGAAALAGIIIDSVHAASLAKQRKESFTDSELEDLNLFLKSYLGSDLSYRLELLQKSHPLIHPHALEWSATLDAKHLPARERRYYLISVGAEEFNIIPGAPEVAEGQEETLEKSLEQKDVVIDGKTFIDNFIKLKFALQGYEFYYSAFQQVQKLQIIQKENISQRLNYTGTIHTLNAFKNSLNSVLMSNGYKRLNKTTDFFGSKPFPEKIKFRFNVEDQVGFNLSKDNNQPEVYVLGGDCPDYILLEDAHELDSARFSVVYGFFSRIDDIINDLTAENTKPWLEWTLEYFYPEYIVDYGLNMADPTEEQENALICFLEKELGFGDGQLIDSLTQSILSAWDVMRDEFSSSACIPREDRHKYTWWGKKLEEYEERDKALKDKEKRNEMIEKFRVREYKKLVDEQIKEISKSESWKADNTSDPNKKPTEYDIEKYTNKKLGQLNSEALDKAAAKYDDPNASWHQNKPWAEDARVAAEETFESDTLLLHELHDLFNPKPSSEELLEFVSAIGICGTSKTAEKAIECLTNGLTLEDLTDLVIEKMIEGLRIKPAIKWLSAGIPDNIRSAMESLLAEEFGNISLFDLLEVKAEQGGSLTVGDLVGKDRKIINETYRQYLALANPTLKEFEKYPYAVVKVGISKYTWHPKLSEDKVEIDRDPDSGKIILLAKDAFGYDSQKKAIKKIKRRLRKLLTVDNLRLIEAAKSRFEDIKGSFDKAIEGFNQTAEQIRDGLDEAKEL